MQTLGVCTPSIFEGMFLSMLETCFPSILEACLPSIIIEGMFTIYIIN